MKINEQSPRGAVASEAPSEPNTAPNTAEPRTEPERDGIDPERAPANENPTRLEPSETLGAFSRFMRNQGFGAGDAPTALDARTAQKAFAFLAARPAIYAAFYSTLDASAQESWPPPATAGDADAFARAELTLPMLTALMAIGNQADRSHVEEETFALARDFVESFDSIDENDAAATGRAVVHTIAALEAAANSPTLPAAHRALAERNIEALRRKTSHELAALVDGGNRDRAVAFLGAMAESGDRGVPEAGVIAGRTLLAVGPKDADADNLVRALANEKPSFWETFLAVLAEIFTLGFAKTDWGDGDMRGKATTDLATDPRFVHAFAEQTNDAGTSAAEVMREAVEKGRTSAADQRSLEAFNASLEQTPQVARPATPRALLDQATDVVALVDARAITEDNAHHMGASVARTIANLDWIVATPESSATDVRRAERLLGSLREKSAKAVADFARVANQDRAVMFLHGVATAETSWTTEGRAAREAGALTGAALLRAGPESSSAEHLVDALAGKERTFWNNFFDFLIELFTFSLARTAWGDGDARGERTTELMHQREFVAGLESAKNDAGVSGADVVREAFARGYRSRADARVSQVFEEALAARRAAGVADAGVSPPVTSPEQAAERAFPGAGFGLFDAARPPIPVAEMATLFPEQFGSMSYDERYAWEREVTDRLEVLITASEPDEILNNLRTQYADADPAEQLMVARAVADIMGSKNYDYEALNTDTPTNTTPQQMLEAMQEAVRTGNKVPEGICGDIHLATATVLNAMGIDAGIGAVQSHFISTMRLSDGTFAIIDYGTLYLGRSMAEVFSAYEESKGQLAIWHLVTDAEGNYVGRVQTPVGRFLEQKLSPAQTFADHLQGKPLPDGVRVDMYNRRGQIEGDVEAAGQIVGGLHGRVAGGGATVHGTELDFVIAGLGYESEHFTIRANAGLFEAEFPSGQSGDYVGGDIRMGVRDSIGNLSYGASIGGSGMAHIDKQKGTGTSEARVGAVYDVPLGSEDGSAYFGVQAIGLPAGHGPDGGTVQGALLAGGRAIAFHNRELEFAAGVKLNLEQAQLHLGGRVTMSNLDRGQGVFVRYVSGRTQLDLGFDHFDQQAWQGRSGNQMRVAIGRSLGNGWTVQAGGRMRLEGDQLGELSLRKTGHIDWPFDDEVPDEARATIESWGYDPDQILQPRAGLMRGLQYQALVGLQAGVRMSPQEYAALGIRVDFAEGTIVLPKWMHESAHVNIAASGAITLRNFCQLELGPVLAMDAEFGGWNLGLLATWRRLRAAVAIGGENRFVAGAQLGLGATGFASAFVGYQRFRPDGTRTTVTVGTDFNVTIEQGEITFGGFNQGTSMGLSGAETWTYRNPGNNVANAATGEVFAHKRALSTSGFMDLFQFVSKTPEQKAKIAVISSRLAAASERGVGFFFSTKALGELRDDDTLERVTEFVQSPGFERMITETAGTWEGDVGADAIVFDSFSGGRNSFDADKGDIHIGDIAFDEGAERPMVHNADIKVLKPGRRALATAWRRRGLRLLDLDGLSSEQFRGLSNLLGYVERNLEVGQMTNKQISFTAGGLRNLAESIGLLAGTKDTEAGATVALSPRILERLADAHLGPCAIELSPGLSETEQLMAGRLTRHLESEGLLVNGKQTVRFHGADFPGERAEMFVARGDTILVNLSAVGSAKTDDIESAFESAVDDSDLLEALAHFRRERTQEQRLTGMARQAGRGTMAVYYPDAPPRGLEDGAVVHRYRAYDVYGDPLENADGNPLERAFEITLRDDASRTDIVVVWDDGRQERLSLSEPDHYLALADSYPELRPLLEGMIGEKGHLPGLRLLHLMRLVESERTAAQP